MPPAPTNSPSAPPEVVPEAQVLIRLRQTFVDADLDWRDIEDNYASCETDYARIGVLLRWIDQQCHDDEWKDAIPKEVIQEHGVDV